MTTKETKQTEPEADNGACILTLIHRDKGRYSAMLPPEEGAEPTYYLFERDIPVDVPPHVFELLKDLEWPLVEGPADLELPLFRAGEPPPEAFETLAADAQLAVVNERVNGLTDELREAVKGIKALTTEVGPPPLQGGGPSPEIEALSARQRQLEDGQGQIADALSELTALVRESASPKPRKKAAKKRRKPRAKNTSALLRTVDATELQAIVDGKPEAEEPADATGTPA